MTEREDAIRRIEKVIQMTHEKSLTVTIPKYTAELVVSLLKNQPPIYSDLEMLKRLFMHDYFTHHEYRVVEKRILEKKEKQNETD